MKGTWGYHHPTNVHFGNDALDGLAAVVEGLGEGDPVLITGSAAANAHGYTRSVEGALLGRRLHVFDGVEPEPSHQTVSAAADFLATHKPSVVIALGGGSAIDAAKAAACLVGVGDDITPYMDRQAAFSARSVPLIAIPMTAGTGSEVTPFSVLTNSSTHEKKSLPSPYFFPDHAYVVPSFMTTVPQKVRGDVGIDSLAHAYEALWSLNANPVSDALAYQAIAILTSAFERYFEDATSPSAADMACGATIAGLAFSNTLTAGCHALSYPLCDMYGISHGAACAVTLDLVAELNKQAVREKFETVAALLGLASWADVPADIGRLRRVATTIPSLVELGVTRDDLAVIAERAFQPLLRNNPVPMTGEVIVNMLEEGLREAPRA
jgi:alcohol dehydrogenase